MLSYWILGAVVSQITPPVWKGHSQFGSVGNDVRKAVADGFRVENVVATDIHPGKHIGS